MRSVQVTITFDIRDDATDEDVNRIVAAAITQIEDPVDDDGNHVVFATTDVTCHVMFGVAV